MLIFFLLKHLIFSIKTYNFLKFVINYNMFFTGLSSDFKPKNNSEYVRNCKVVSEYAYCDDLNTRKSMEDGL